MGKSARHKWVNFSWRRKVSPSGIELCSRVLNTVYSCIKLLPIFTPFTQLLQTRVCFTNAGINTYHAEIHKVRKHAIYAFPSFLFLILLFRLYVKEPFSEIMERQNNRLV